MPASDPAALGYSVRVRWTHGALLLVLAGFGCRSDHLFLGHQAQGGEDGDVDAESGSSTDSGPVGDLGGTDGTDTGEVVCQRLDLLIVVQNTAEAQLVGNIDPFLDALASAIVPRFEDFHIGVVGTHDAPNTCRSLGTLSGDPRGDGDCGAVQGSWASNEDADLTATLRCLAELGAAEAPMDPTSYALAAGRGLAGEVTGDPGFDATQTCNAGFVRDDALHALIIAGREDDEGSPLEPPDWADWLRPRETQGGLVVTSVLPIGDNCPGATADRAQAWLDMYPEHSAHDVCALQLLETFAAFTAQLDEACQ